MTTRLCSSDGSAKSVCCLGSDKCTCRYDGSACSSSETEVSECGGEVNECPSGKSKVLTCSSAPTSGGSSGSSGSAGSCSDKGYCGPNTLACKCDTSCIHTGVGSYLCGVSCNSDDDCASKVDPQTGAAFTYCTKALDTPTQTYGRFCN